MIGTRTVLVETSPVVSFLVSFVCVQGCSCAALWIVVERV